jgi:hypothetical protein
VDGKVAVGVSVSVAVGAGVSVGETPGMLPWHPASEQMQINPKIIPQFRRSLITIHIS